MIDPLSALGARQLTREYPSARGALTSRGLLGAADAREVTRADGGPVPTAVVAKTLT